MVQGIPNVLSNDTSGIAAAAAMAKTADVVILAVGTDLSWAREGRDATSIELSPAQVSLVDAVATAAKSPVVMAVLTATPLDISAQVSCILR